MRIVYMGTPEIARACLERIYADGHEIAAVYTKIDTPKNRGMKLTASPVKEFAVEKGIPVVQPRSFRDEAVVEQLRQLQPELICVVAYGKILPQTVLDIPKYGCINIISVAIDAPQPVISALSGQIGSLPGVSAKTAYSPVIAQEDAP